MTGTTPDGQDRQLVYTKTVRHGERYGRTWTAIQLTTASAAAAVADLVLEGRMPHLGYVRQEELDFDAFASTPFGEIYAD